MNTIWLYSLISVVLVSLISLIGVATLVLRKNFLQKIVFYLVSFSAGALLGDVFIHLIPEIAEKNEINISVSIFILLGILFSFLIEKVIHWRHGHTPQHPKRVQPFAIMNLLGDGVHNFIDGLIIGASFLISTRVGIASTIAVIFHEIPQEIGDFGVLVHGGFSIPRALFFNFITALTAIAGAILVLTLGSINIQAEIGILAFAAGSFVYIAGSDLIPELHKEVGLKKGTLQLLGLILGIAVMFLLLLVE